MTDTADIATQSITLTQTIQAPIEQLYNAFLSRDGLYYWLCDNADTRAAVGGHLLLTWVNGDHVFGEYTALEPQQRVAFTWHDSRDPENTETEVDVMLDEKRPGVIVISLTHTGLASPEAETRLRIQWEKALATLKAQLENGEDTRITHRVIIGIFPEQLDATSAAKLGVPVTEGTRVTGLINGFSAQQAGLQVDDVIVGVNGLPVTHHQPLTFFTAAKKPGDVVQIDFYRGSERHSLPMELRGYPIPAMTTTFVDYADRLAATYATLDNEIAALCDGTTEVEANARPAPDEWNAKEVIAHLILTERWLQGWMGGLLQSPEVTGYTANSAARLAGLIAVHSTLDDLRAEFRRAMQETTALVRAFPQDEKQRKSNLWWVIFEAEQMITHTRQHFVQLAAALLAARSPAG